MARTYSDEELEDRVKQQAPYLYFDDAQEAYCKMLNENYACVMYFENNSNSSLSAKFNLKLENLALSDEPPGTSEFTVDIEAGGTAMKVMRPINEGEGTSIGMSYTVEFM
jgi:hypothetical protein